MQPQTFTHDAGFARAAALFTFVAMAMFSIVVVAKQPSSAPVVQAETPAPGSSTVPAPTTAPPVVAVEHRSLTSPSGNTYNYAVDASQVTIRGDSEDGNIREVFWRADSRFAADQTSCLDWHDLAQTRLGVITQPGIALRIASSGEGTKAVTVTQNIWAKADWMFNVHVWDSDPNGRVQQNVASFDVSSIIGVSGPGHPVVDKVGNGPVHVCARSVGDLFSFKVWTDTEVEPGWDDPTHVFTTTLPEGWDHPGYAGGYIGHMHSGMEATFEDPERT